MSIHTDHDGTDVAALLRVLRLASPTLPVGTYSYSQGLEWAVETGAVSDADSAQRWIGDVLRFSLARFEAPIWWRLYHCWVRSDFEGASRWNEIHVAARESAELRAETLQMGGSMRTLLAGLGEFDLDPLLAIAAPAYVTAASYAAAAWRIPPRMGLAAYLASWCENQVLAAMKTVPLGQLAGQRLIAALAPLIASALEEAAGCSDDSLSNFAPGLAIASTRHETQYSRLFRS